MAGITTTRKATVFATGSLDLIENKAKAKELIQEESKRYSGGWKGRGPKRAIDLKDQDKYPQLAGAVGVSVNDPKWQERLENFWAEFSYHIPYGWINEFGAVEGGLEIDASYTEDNGKIYAENFSEFLLFEMMKDDREVCPSPELWEQRRSYGYFCIDKTKESERSKELTKVKQDAIIELSKLLVDKDQDNKKGFFRVLAANLDEDITATYARTMSHEQVIQTIITGVEKYPKKFLEAVKDDNLMKKSFIREAIESGAVSRVGNKYYYDNEEFESESMFLAYLSNPANADEKQKIKSKIEEFTLLGV